MDPTGLPVEDVVSDVAAALESNGTGVLVAPPGSGKTTVIPLRLLDTAPGKILVLEPRRLATRAAARRMASLLGEPLGETVGFVTRHERSTSPATRVEVVTEGILTRRLQSDPTLEGISLVIFDELHERNLQTDLGLALALDTRSGLRPDLRLLVMSATIDAGAVSEILGGAPVIEASTRSHPIEMRWAPAPPRSRRFEEHAAATVRRAVGENEGDILVFLPGMAEIRRVQDALQGILADVRVLHGSLPTEEQDLAIAPSTPPFRKVVLSTDIAESSLTVEGVSVVVDSGLARSPRFDPRTGMTRLTTVPISRASADQRAGRAGRLGPGVAYRLWSKMEHAARPSQIVPEISQVDLAGLVLELAAWGVSEPSRLTWIDSPPRAAWSEGVELLQRLGALDDDGHLSPSGREMASLPLHPRLARMIVDAGPDRALAAWLATVIDERDPLRGRPDDLPVDAAVRVRLLTDRDYRHPAAIGSALHRLRDAAADLARRAGIGSLHDVDLDHCGRVLALGFPDRLAIRRGSPGRFQLRTGTTAFMPDSDSLAPEEFVVAADLDGRRKNARIRMAAGIDRSEVAKAFSHEVDHSLALTWEGDRLVERSERRLGGIVLDSNDQRPSPGDSTVAALLKRMRDRGIESLPWSRAAEDLRQRSGYLHRLHPAEWPDMSDRALISSLDDWLAPFLTGATGWDDVTAVDLTAALRHLLGRERATRLADLAPTHVRVPSGRKVRLDYGRDTPTLSVRVQDMFGATSTPTVGGEPVVVELLSPANRPIQVTSDLAGFWKGSWKEVRKEMAGRYPKHDWPENP